ncbi:sex peptide receptor-related protein 2 isoform X4 [Tenebrio molitor]|uniref:sex peptide receptor-related protein 2 isoform X4 n=1 Tax=Tenebrio molitor TaxID=7067 RepID=UPI0036249DDE
MDDANEDPSALFLESTRFWIQRVFVPIMVCIGVGGNTITVVVLTRKRMRCSTNIYLTALAVADIIYLLFVFFLSFGVYKNIHDRKYELYWRFSGLTHWLCDSASSASVWLTVSFTLERYIAVCHPIKGKVLCTENRAKIIITGITVFCILSTLSTTFEYELAINEKCIRNCTPEELKTMQHMSVVTNLQHDDEDDSNDKLVKEIYSKVKPAIDKLLPVNCTSHPHIIYVPVYPSMLNKTNPKSYKTNLIEGQVNTKSEVSKERVENSLKGQNANTTAATGKLLTTNDTSDNDTCCLKKFTVDTELTNLGKNRAYSTFMSWFSALGFALIPLILIATFNCFLVHAVYKSQNRRKKMTNSQETVSMSNENRITVMLIGVVFLFLICQTPTASFLIYSNFYEPKDLATEHIHRALGNIFNFLVTVNAATNFIMYCILSKKYRTTFRALFCGRRKNRQDTLMLSSTRTRYSSYNNGLRRNVSEYHTPRNLETQSLTGIPRSKSLMTRPPGKAKSSDMNF